MQECLCKLFKYVSDGVEGLGWEVFALGSKGRNHNSALKLVGNTLGFTDYCGRPCALSFQFAESENLGHVTATYRISRIEDSYVEDGDVLFGADTLLKAYQGKLFSYIQTPD